MVTTLVYSSPGIMRDQGILRNLSNIYDGLLSTELFCATLVFSHIQNPVKYLWWKILFTTWCNPSIFRTVAYSESKAYSEYCQTSITKYFIQNLVQSWHIQKPSIFRTLVYSEIKAYLEPCRKSKMGHFLRTLCNYSRFSRGPI